MPNTQTTYLERLSISFGVLYRYLECPSIARRVVVFLLVIHSALLAYSAYVHSPTLNEPGHLVAGLSHWKFGRFELYRVNPPLVRMVAALPVMAAGYEDDWSRFYEKPGARPVFEMGVDFIAVNGERSYWLFAIARWACIPFSLLGAIVCYLWARDLFSSQSGVVACLLWCFSPNILGHAALITADVHATSLGIAACYTFWRWLKNPTWTQAALTGCVLGLAELAKTTLILFYPLWPLLWVTYRWPNIRAMLWQDWLREAGMLLLRMAIGLHVLNLGYGYEGSLEPLKEFHFVSRLFTGSVAEEGGSESAEDSTTATPKSINRFSYAWIGEFPVPFPKNYLIGIDLQQRDFEDFGRPSYLCGKFQEHGWWYYYIYALAVKVPLGTWLLAIVVTALSTSRRNRGIQWRDILFLLFPPLLIFYVVSSKTGFSHHMRYVFPCFPFIFIWLSQVTTAAAMVGSSASKQRATKISSKLLMPIGACFALAWSVLSSLTIYPHSISYFNEIAGGPTGGSKHLINSNIDWGQDLLMLKWWREKHAEELQGRPFHLAYYGYLEPADLGFSDALAWPLEEHKANSSLTNKLLGSSQQFDKLTPGYYAISINYLQGYRWPARDGANKGKKLLYTQAIEKLRNTKPCVRVSYALMLYYIQ